MNRLKRIVTLSLAFCFGALMLSSCGGSAASAPEESTSASQAETSAYSSLEESVPAEVSSVPTQSKGDNPMVEITMKDGGVIKLELDSEAAPITVENFVSLVGDEFYDGLIFHRIIPGFMIQGGDPEGTGMGGSKQNIKGEFTKNGWDNPISHEPGVISMARSSDPDSASSQFFITHGDATFLDGDYAAFGRVVEGMDVVDAIANVRTGANDRPVEDVVIDTIRIVE